MTAIAKTLLKCVDFISLNSRTFAVIIMLATCATIFRHRFQEHENLARVAEKLAYRSKSSSENAIPRIIHQSWKSKHAVPAYFAPWISSWIRLNPGWSYSMWDDRDNLAFIEYRFPQYRELARHLSKNMIALADFTRYAIMYEIGGVYADMDFECLQPFDKVIQGRELIMSTEPLAHAVLLDGGLFEGDNTLALCNAILASRPAHPFWLKLMDTIKARYASDAHLLKGSAVTSLTGPHILQYTYDTFFRNSTSITVLPEEYFYPEVAFWNWDLKKGCEKRKDPLALKACDYLEKYPNGRRTENTAAVHHWQCSWCSTRFAREHKEQVPIETILRNSSYMEYK